MSAGDPLTKAAEAYRGCSVLVTGADGFIGSHLTETLLSWGAEVSIMVRRPPHKLRHISHLRDRLSIHQGDVKDYDRVYETVSELPRSGNVLIFHLAAHTHVGESWEYPAEVLKTNVLGTVNLLWAVREAGLKLSRFSYAGSSEEYGSFDEQKSEGYHRRAGGEVILDEAAPVNPKSVYATSKLAADFLTRNFFDAYGVPTVVSRLFNVFGPRQNPRFITGTVITQALMREVVQIGWPHGLRDFTCVEDGVHGHLMAAAFGRPGETYVIGQGKNLSIGDWAQLILDLGHEHGFWERRKLSTKEDRYRPGSTDQAELLADASHLRELCGWTPRVSWEEGILRTIRWYAENQDAWMGLIDWQ